MDFKRGRLFVIEGADGSGKKTQSNILHKHLLRLGYETELLDFPQYGKNIFADTVQAYLQREFGDPTKINPYLASLPYAGDRLLVAPKIRQGIDDGVIHICNRYKSSNDGHQGAKIQDSFARHKYFEWSRRVEYSEHGFNIPRPDLVALLDVDPAVSQQLVSARAESKGVEKDGHENNLDYLVNVARTFREIAAGDPTWRIVESMEEGKLLSPDVIAVKVWKTIEPYLPPINY